MGNRARPARWERSSETHAAHNADGDLTLLLAMTFASPVAPAPPEAAERSAAADPSSEDLSARIAAAAAHAGSSEAALREQWLQEGLERYEALHGLQAAGR